MTPESSIPLPPGVNRAGLWDERRRLAAKREQLTRQSRELAFQHYPTFISAANCCQAIAADFAANQTKLEEAVKKLPELSAACAEFKEKTQQITLRRKRTSLVLAKHPRLLEVLELPQLMETCVKNGHHEEALAIQQLCAKLHKPLGSVPLIQSVLHDVHSSSVWMLNQLLVRLKGPVQLPECLKIIGYIRRMSAFNETQLRLKFLQAREAHFQSQMPDIPSDGSPHTYASLCRVIELTRICVFDTLTQYRALFTDEDTYYSASSGFGHVVYRQIFSSWLFMKLKTFLDVFATHAAAVDMEEQSVDSLLGQAMYFGQSLGRVGFDFRLLIVPIFVKIILERAMSNLKKSIQELEDYYAGKGAKAIEISTVWERCDEVTLPRLEEGHSDLKIYFHLLADVCNSVINTCNKLRYTPPVAVQPALARGIQQFVDRAKDLVELSARTAESEYELKVLEDVRKQFKESVIPFCNRCINYMFRSKDEEFVEVEKFKSFKKITGGGDDVVDEEVLPIIVPSEVPAALADAAVEVTVASDKPESDVAQEQLADNVQVVNPMPEVPVTAE